MADNLLCGQYALIAKRLGYAQASGRDHDEAIREDFERALAENGGLLKSAIYPITVKSLNMPNRTYSVIEV
ncbi:MAG: hypothetical protein EOO68_05980 [Moraxellaceae bacterium]|nr:MAG: hypothetical protein EOO68_05980 [Moraxellaceae bacterium]